jgi:hypothetical protein
MLRRARVALMLIGALACDSRTERGASTATVASVFVQPAVLRIRTGEVAQLSAQINDSAGRAVGGAELEYSTSTPTMLRVSPTGVVTPLGPLGSGTIIAASGSTRKEIPVAVTAGAPHSVRISAGAEQVGEAGTTLTNPIVVNVVDAFDNPVARSDLRVQPSSGGTVEPQPVTTDALGTARLLWTLGTLSGPQTLQVTAGVASLLVEATAVAGRMATVRQIGAPVRRTSAGDTLPVRIRAADSHDNGVPGVVMVFSVERGDGSITPGRIETGADGLGVGEWVTGVRAGLNVLRVRVIDVGDTTIRIDVRTRGGSPARVQLVRGGGNQRAAAGSAVSVAPAVRVRDRFDNAVSAARVRFTPLAGGTVERPDAVTEEDGIASAGRWVLGSAGENVLVITVDGIADTLRVVARAINR